MTFIRAVRRAAGLSAVFPAALAAQGGASGIAAEIAGCRVIKGSAERLACFDRAAAALAGSPAIAAPTPQPEARKEPRATFGLPPAAMAKAIEPERPDIAQIASTVVGLSSFGRDRWTVRLADGSTWRTTEAARLDPEQGDTVVIKRAALGTFRGSFQGARPVRMQRLR